MTGRGQPVLPDANFGGGSRASGAELAQGPTRAHAPTKQVVRSVREGGVNLADQRTAKLAGELFETADLRGAVRSFLTDGPGKATFSGR